MNNATQELIEQINLKTKNSSLIYFSKDAERATGLEDYLTNYNVVAFEQSEIAKALSKKLNVYTNNQGEIKSILDLLDSELVKIFIKHVSKEKSFYAQFFQLAKPYINKINQMGGSVLNNSPELNRKFEDKFSQYQFFVENNLDIPQSMIVELSNISYLDVVNKLGSQFVIQMDRAHTGTGTFFVESKDDWEVAFNKLQGNKVKISKKINGDTYTINACITKKDIFIGQLQYQITAVPQLASGKGTTVGNDFSYANKLDSKVKTKIFNLVKKIGLLMRDQNYIGLFGIDLILEDNQNPLIIEINARQTANVSFATKLEILQDLTPMLAIHLAEFLKIDSNIKAPEEILPIEGSQIFLRSKTNNFKINHQLKTGIYRLQSDNSAIDWNTLKQKEGVIFIDEELDKPLILQNEGYSIMDVTKESAGFVLLTQSINTIKNETDEVARMQFLEGIINNGSPKPWIIEALNSIESILK